MTDTEHKDASTDAKPIDKQEKTTKDLDLPESQAGEVKGGATDFIVTHQIDKTTPTL